jgi:hypothetical protein
MSILTYLTEAVVRDSVKELDGKTLNRPRLLVSDGTRLTYGVDVDIGQKKLDPDTADEVVAPLRNVPIAAGVHELLYADAGAAVRLRRSSSGRWEVTGFSKRMPGTYRRIGVRIPFPGIGPVAYELEEEEEIGLTARALIYGELASFGGYGNVPYGAIGLFRGDTLIEIGS